MSGQAWSAENRIRKWKLILEISDDGLSDTGPGHYLSEEEIKTSVLLDEIAGLHRTIISCEEIK